MNLPRPTRTRWQPLRSGLINIYRYDVQEFQFEDGRLLLRGNNGTGKSRVLALQLPFLLDGEIGPHRLEPDGDAAKRIEWNLLMDRHEQRRGYTWVEFGRRDAAGVDHHLTLGCGLYAIRGRGAPTRWFFLTSRRVGLDLALVENNAPVSKERLRAILGGEGEIHETAEGWRGAVDRALFKLGPRYKPLLDLLVQLRQPQLSRQLDEGRLSRALSMALPPLSERVVRPLADAFRGLEADQSELEGFEEAEDAAADFLKRYRSYAGVAARRRAQRMRTASAAWEAANRAALRAAEELDAAGVARESASGEARAAAEAQADVRTRLGTLEAAPAMDRARELDRARQDVVQEGTRRDGRRAEAASAVARHVELGRREATARARHADAVGALGAAIRELEAGVGPVGLAVPTLDPVPDGGAWSRLLDARRRAAGQLAAQDEQVARSLAELGTAERDHDRARSEVDHAVEEEVAAERARAAEAERLIDLAHRWLAEAPLLAIAPAVVEDLGAWVGDAAGPNPLEVAVEAARAREEARVARGRAELRVERAGLVAEHGTLADELRVLEAGTVRAPRPWPGRARAEGEAGAPLWRLCEFRDEIGDADRAGLEAALEAAGLLDAWLRPDGAVLTGDTLDAVLTLDAPVEPVSLRAALVPCEGGDVPRVVIEGVLDRIGLDAGATRVGRDGGYRLGPLVGRWRKARAEHIGEAARERARLARIAELRVGMASLQARIDTVDAGLGELDARDARLRHECAARPRATELARLGAVREAAQATTRRRQAALVVAEQRAITMRTAHGARVAARDTLALDLGLMAWVGRERELTAALHGVEIAASTAFTRHAAAREAAIVATTAAADLAVAEQVVADAQRALADAEARARAVTVHRDTLEATHGAEVAAILAGIEAARRDLRAADGRVEAARTAHLLAERRHGAAESDLAARQGEVASREADREDALVRLRALVDAGLLGVLHVPEPEGAWNPTRALALARELEELLSGASLEDDAWSRVQNALYRDIEELRRSLLDQRWDPVQRVVDDLAVVEVNVGGEAMRVPALRQWLEAEVRQRKMVLTAKEREVIENHLVGELATELHELIHQGAKLVRQMSAEVERRATSTGMRLRFDWRLRDDAGAGVTEARARLMKHGAAWSPADRELIAAFLKGRLDDQRQVDAGETWQGRIEKAFDYRDWHSFVVERQQDGQWRALTRRTHGTGSGGEKAIALTIPQLAAAAAYYAAADPDAPRLILLDEAFVGVDTDMRAKSMGLLATFDLDFLMTSEREWACYATLPGVAICQLTTRPGLDAIDVVRWVWNGRERAPG